MSGKLIYGISVCNPVDIEEEYLNNAIDYAIKKGYDHIQFIGPIHNPVKGNIDGMALYKKYDGFNDGKDGEFIQKTMRIVNAACEKAGRAGIKTFVWHHELEVPAGFGEAFPQTLNDYGDIEVSSPEVVDFLEYKIIDFFEQYPGIDGIVLTLHETKVPLLKLKHQKLDRMERVKLVTEILYQTCKRLGKELIARPFASVEEDYEMMAKAYEEISPEIMIMDKWTQFDWSLCLPDNPFFSRVNNNPLFVETDIFGEFFGKGRFPLMLKEHIVHKYAYCRQFAPAGYCSRIDRAGEHPFGDVNEVNLDIMHACLANEDVEDAIDAFFACKYGDAAGEVRKLMEPTEEIQKKMLYVKGYYLSELSLFPSLNHCKNDFYFEMMRDRYEIASDEWYIPAGWSRGSFESIAAEKQEAVDMAERAYSKLLTLRGRMDEEEYHKLHIKFLNLKICASVWKTLVWIFYYYTKYFERKEEEYAAKLEEAVRLLLALHAKGKEELGSRFYCSVGDSPEGSKAYEYIPSFVNEVRESFLAERRAYEELEEIQGIYDSVICGAATEGHKLQKEVNFSDTRILNGRPCRIPGNNKGLDWSAINAHGWFSYEINVKPMTENLIKIHCSSDTARLEMRITLGDAVTEVKAALQEDEVIELRYAAKAENCVRIRFDRISGNTPRIYSILVLVV